MVTIIDIDSIPSGVINIGREGEYDLREVRLNMQSWGSSYAGGLVSVIYERPDGVTYPVTANAPLPVVTWLLSAADLSVSGAGRLEARLYYNGGLAKSATIPVTVSPSITNVGGTPLNPVPDWTYTVVENATRAQTSAENAEASASAAGTAATEAAAALLEAAQESGVFDGVGIASVVQTTTSTENGGDNIITVTLTDGTTSTFTVKNGSAGSGGSVDEDAITEAIETALAEAKASGEFDGTDGADGADGYTPVKGTDYWTDADKTEMLTYLADNLTAADIGAIPSSGRNVANANIAFGAITNGLIADGTIEVSKLSASAVTSLVNSVLAALPVWTGGNY